MDLGVTSAPSLIHRLYGVKVEQACDQCVVIQQVPLNRHDHKLRLMDWGQRLFW